jgi:hypothetical protein
METHDSTDLTRLDAFVSSIEAATAVSEPAAKMHRLFQVLHKIAARYIEVNVQQCGGASSAPVMDAQLAALGIPQAGLWETHDRAGFSSDGAMSDHYSLNPLLWTGDNVQLEDWFYTNQEFIELL